MNIMPFNFEKLECGDFFISNSAGFHDVVHEKDFMGLINSSSTGCEDSDRRLRRKLFVSLDQDVEVATYSLASGTAKKIVNDMRFNPTYMIVPTLRCDHACTYCQVSRASMGAKKYDMPERYIKNIIEKIAKLSDPPYKIEIQGGEPLVRFDLIKNIYDEALRVLGEGDFELVVATSLSLLDQYIIDWSKKRSVYFSVSLDGSKLIHNKNRILSGGDSFDKARDGIKWIIKELGVDKVSTVTTVTKELLKYPGSLVDAHKELGIPSFFVRPISPYGFAEGNKEEMYTISEYMTFYRSLFNRMKNECLSGSPMLEYSALVHVRRVMNPGFSQYADLKSPGGFIFNSILFDYDGRVYGSDESRMLQRVLPNVDFSFGKVDEGVASNNPLYKHIISNSFSFIHPGCGDCAYQPFCGVDACQHISQQGEPVGDKSISLFCNYHKEMFGFIINEYYSDPGSRKILDEWCYG